MDSDKTTPQNSDSSDASSATSQQAPADALSRTPDDLETEQAVSTQPATEQPAEKKISPIKRFLRKVNIYLLIFILIVVIAGVVTVVYYLNSQKAPTQAGVTSQPLSQESLKQLANTDASVGNTNQTLTIQGNAIIAGQTLMRGNLNIAGNLQTGGSITAPSITIAGATNLGETQVNTLQVSSNAAIQGSSTMRDISVSGASSFSGAVTASQITVTRLILAGNGTLEIPNHISFTGPSPSRTINSGVLGAGGTASVSGSDTSGSVSINSGNNPTVGCFVDLKFNQAFTKAPYVLVSPVGAAAGNLQFYATRSPNGFSICTNNAAAANQSFAFDYFVTN